MDTSSKQQKDYTAEILLTAGYILFFCLACSIGIVFYILLNSPRFTEPVNIIATNLPPKYPIAQIDDVSITDAEILFEDRFDNDKNTWVTLDSTIGKIEVNGGNLSFQSTDSNGYTIAGCKSCPYFEEPYYLQVDIQTSKITDEAFGVIFNVGKIQTDFYLFEINTESKEYKLYHHNNADGWALRVSGDAPAIKPFPEVNTLGLHANGALIELYINGGIVDTYSYFEEDKPLHNGYFGFYVDDPEFKLIIDNLIIRKGGN